MTIVEIIRLEESEQGTIGVIKIDKEVFCFSLEPSDLLNKPNESCIPTGQYLCTRIVSPKFGETFEVVGVPDRKNILFHKGNTKADTMGCIILGQTVDKLKGQRAVLNSGATFEKFMQIMTDEQVFHLTITTEY